MEKASSILASVFGSREPVASATVATIFVYPIKSCRGISVPRACITSTGLRWDRQWLVVNSKGRGYTQRVEQTLALVEIELPIDAFREDWEPNDISYMVIKAPQMEPLKIPLNREHAAIDDISVWEWSGSALDEGNEAFEWFTKYLGKPSRLVRFNTVSEIRAVDPDYAQGYKTAFSDAFPFLLASQGSLNSVNELLEEPLSVNRFRANIIVDGCDPFSEDLWKEIKINKLTFCGVKLCARCKWLLINVINALFLLVTSVKRFPENMLITYVVEEYEAECSNPSSFKPDEHQHVPTINQENGSVGNEPTQTLMKFRSDHAMHLKEKKGKVFFGQNLICKDSLSPTGRGKSIAVGDPVCVLQKYPSYADAPVLGSVNKLLVSAFLDSLIELFKISIFCIKKQLQQRCGLI
ncbi:hypothetical protein C4D60_Mb01t28520 [Musa balbisiana]|uniref:MOSC domain-containing protein n=1 Tax=Musa balbisiana TaxID=52838 RepID=A0A4S8JRE0_MUSBA|nr:hypothetical protein C4D60_Mb01t28520 [Musa balbisiana]